MRNNQRNTSGGLRYSRFARKVAAMLPVLLALALATQAQVTNHNIDWVGGDVFVGKVTSNTSPAGYQVWHSANPNAARPSYINEQLVQDGLNGTTAGCGFDLAYRFFGTNSAQSLVDRYAIANAHTVVQQLSTAGSSSSQSVVLDSGANMFIGYAGSNTIERWTKDMTSGLYTLTASFTPLPVDSSGPGWLDLASDGQTIFYTSQGRKIYQFNTGAPIVAGTNPVLWADLSTLNGSNNQGTLFAIRILPNGGATARNGVLVADQKNVKLVKASGGVITSVQVFKFNPLANLQALTLDAFSPATTFWVGDASATTNNLLRYNMSTGKTEVTLSTGAGVGGVCQDAGFNAAQLNYQPVNLSNSTPNFQTAVFNLSPPSNGNPNSNTLVFTSPFTGETLTATLPNLANNVTVTIRDSLVDPSVALSDPTVFSFNPGNPTQGSPVAGNMPCDQHFTNLAGYSPSCEVLAFEANPNSGFSLPNIQIAGPVPDDVPNLRLLSNLDEDGTDGIIDYPLTSKNCVLTVNQQTSNAAYTICSFSPANGTVFNKGNTATISFRLNVTQTGQCGNNQTTPNFLQPLLMIDQLLPSVNGVTPAPANIQVLIAGNSGGPPIMTFSGNTYQLQIKTSDMPSGFDYLVTVIDLTSTIPSTSVKITLQ